MSDQPETPEEQRAEQRVEQRAEALEEQRVEQAEALEEKRAGQAVALERERVTHAEALVELQAEQRIEQRVVERIEQRADIKNELREITAAIGQLIEHMDQALPEERVQAMVDAIVSEERGGRKRLTATIVGALSIIILLAASSLVQSHYNGKTLNEAKTVSSYVRNCLQHPEALTPAQKTTQCGAGTYSSQSFFIKYLNCAFLIHPTDRTPALLDNCVKRALGG